MKKSMYKSAYRVVSWLSDVSGGASAFVRWKVALAALIIGVSATSLAGCKPEATCYKPEPTCYLPVEPGPDDGGEAARTVVEPDSLEPLPRAEDQ